MTGERGRFRLLVAGVGGQGVLALDRDGRQVAFDGDAVVEITYFTSGISWSADYVLVADKEESEVNFEGFVRDKLKTIRKKDGIDLGADTVEGLAEFTGYAVAIVAVDEAGNESTPLEGSFRTADVTALPGSGTRR